MKLNLKLWNCRANKFKKKKILDTDFYEFHKAELWLQRETENHDCLHQQHISFIPDPVKTFLIAILTLTGACINNSDVIVVKRRNIGLSISWFQK